MSSIAADRLGKRFGRIDAVADLSFAVEPGEVVGFLGPNGAGKTTTIRMLMGFLRPTTGRCQVLGGSLADEVALRRRVGYLPGDFRLDPAMTPAEALAWFGRLRGRTSRARVTELTDRLGLDPSQRFGSLSKGNRQKAGIVQAFAHDPDVLLLDEPSTGLDPLVQRELLRLVGEAAGRGAAVLFSSHVLPEVERAATRVVIIRAGRLVSTSTVEDLLDRAHHRLELRYAEPVPDGLFAEVPGVVESQTDGRTAVIGVDGPVGPALRAALAGPDLLRIGSAGDDLEDLFVSLYTGRQAAHR